jgi:hypothetical protein
MVMRGQQLLPLLGELNAAFGGMRPTVTAAESRQFAPGRPLGEALASVLDPAHADRNQVLAAFVAAMPGGIQESLRSAIHYALTAKPQVLLNFSWTPAYDFEVTLCEIVEAAPAQSGISILLKSRYPDHMARFAAT